MQALRQIIDVTSHLLKIHLPKNFEATKVEVIILPIEDEPTTRRSVAKFRGKLNLSNEQYNDFQTDVKKSREEWHRDF